MLLLLQAAHAAAAPVHIIVDSVPKSADWPEWAKILISAGVGAVVGIGSNILMEFVKPGISRGISRKNVATHIDEEFLRNLRKVKTALAISEEGKKNSPDDESERLRERLIIESLLENMATDRHGSFFENDKSIVYEIDPNGYLLDFYSTAKTRACSHYAQRFHDQCEAEESQKDDVEFFKA